MPIKSKTRVLFFIATVIFSLVVCCLTIVKGENDRQLQIRNLIRMSLPNVMSENIEVLCKSNDVASSFLFFIGKDRICLCYDIDGRFYCLQQTGQLFNFPNKEFAVKTIKPDRIIVLYNRDKSVPQFPNEISSWLKPKEYKAPESYHNKLDAPGGPHGHQ